MNRRRFTARVPRSFAILVLAGCALAAGAPAAHSVNVVTGYHRPATIGGQFVFYLGGPVRTADPEPTQSEVRRFDTTSGLTQTVFTVPTGWAVAELVYRGGRLFIKLDSDLDNEFAATRLLSTDSDGGDLLELAATGAAFAGGTDCFPFMHLAAISHEGEAIVSLVSAASFPGSECAAMKASVAVTAIAPDGTKSELLAATSPWLAGTRDDVGLGFIFEWGVWAASGNWLLKYGQTGANEFGIVARDRTTGATFPTALDSAPDDFRVWPDGSAFADSGEDCNDCGAFVIPAITERKVIRLRRRRFRSGFLSCGDRILEHYSRTYKRVPPRYARLALRDHAGRVVRTLPQRVPGSSELVGCDGETALLRRIRPPVFYDLPTTPTSGPGTKTGTGTDTTTGTPTTPPPSSAAKRRSAKRREKPELLFTVPLG